MKIGEIVGSSFVYRTESTILRAAVRTAKVEDAFLSARRQARQWLSGICGRYGIDVAAAADIVESNERCGIDLIVRPTFLVAAVRHSDDRFPERTWHTNLELQAEEGGDVAVCNVRLRAEHPSNARPIDPHPSRIFGILCSEPGLYDAEAMQTGAPLLRPSDVPRLVALIDSLQRRLPVILVSRPPALDASAVARELAGLAHVFELDEDTSWEISRRYERRQSAYLGAVKIYPPGVTFASKPDEAPLFLPETLQMLARDRKAESTVRRGVLADLTAQFEAEPLLTPPALRVQEAAQRAPAVEVKVAEAPVPQLRAAADDDVHRARQEAAAARQEAEGYWREILAQSARVEQLQAENAQLRQTELGISVEELSTGHRDLLRTIFGSMAQVREALLENDRLLAELEQLRGEYEAQRARFARGYEGGGGRGAVPVLEPLPRPDWNDFEALRRWADTQYAGTLVLHPRVRDRLEDGNPQDIDALFDILDILGTDYAAMKRGIAGARERYVERTKRYKAGKALTETGAGLARGGEYACSFDGTSYGADEHQHIRERGRNFTGRTVCVYFVYDDANNRVIVTSMPRHLDSVSSRT